LARDPLHSLLSSGMMMAVGLFVLGLTALIVGAELMVQGGSQLAARLGIPPLVVGLTIVAIGTSMPELSIGVVAALRGNGALAVGNIAGTNTVNLLLIFGLSALLRPLPMNIATLRFDLPAMAVAAVVLLALAWDGMLTRAEGALMVGGAIAYTAGIVHVTRRESQAVRAEFDEEYGEPPVRATTGEVLWNLAMLLGGIVVIVVGSGWLVDGAVVIAHDLGVSDAFIGLTVVALGTSSPELATAIVATLRDERDIAVGNLLGSSVYNILLILGVTCLVPASGIAVDPTLVRVDIPVMAAVTLTCVPVFWTGRRVSRLEGGVFVAAYGAYLTYLIVNRT
jgi:cation:H+ antiporter